MSPDTSLGPASVLQSRLEGQGTVAGHHNHGNGPSPLNVLKGYHELDMRDFPIGLSAITGGGIHTKNETLEGG